MSKNRKIKIVILAAGKGTRMESDLPKVLAPLKGKNMIRHVIESVQKASNEKPIAIIGHKAELVQSDLGDLCFYVLQKEQLGTGHAVSCAKGDCEGAEDIVVLSGDQPFIKAETIKNLIEKHLETGAKITLATTIPLDFSDWKKAFLVYGRILRENGKIIGIREFKNATDKEKEIKEVNTGCYMFNADWLWKNLDKIENKNAQGEYYLTDLFHIAFENGDKIESIEIEPHEALGANTKEDLEVLENFAV
ncbi:NTP transferase domain-containing protein [Patescibacteria group bacterium]|nr:NTP transferase domain-containing protein [Patescibacteria group bacterium]